ncbi:MAG: hypothetical protein JSR58_00040 [Verrucomicrobia bacterium]|nr:hypothetical protein [Verrucomicrobiota bacterium]
MRVDSVFPNFTWRAFSIPSTQELYRCTENIFRTQLPKVFSKQNTPILIGSLIFIGCVWALYPRLKPTLMKIKIIWNVYQLYRRAKKPQDPKNQVVSYALGKGNIPEELKTLSLSELSSVFSSAEKQALKEFKTWKYDTLLNHYKNTYVRGGRYEYTLSEWTIQWTAQVYVQRWRTKMLLKVLVEHFRSKIDIPEPKTPAENELFELAKKPYSWSIWLQGYLPSIFT